MDNYKEYEDASDTAMKDLKIEEYVYISFENCIQMSNLKRLIANSKKNKQNLKICFLIG
jgi:hypothetical protein